LKIRDAQRKHGLFRNLRLDPQTIWSWAALIAAALIIFWMTRGAQYHQFALGILLSSMILLVALLLFEVLWRLLEAIFDTE
jgi:hypothetical protein